MHTLRARPVLKVSRGVRLDETDLADRRAGYEPVRFCVGSFGESWVMFALAEYPHTAATTMHAAHTKAAQAPMPTVTLALEASPPSDEIPRLIS
jgi:hypothetical protein